MRGLGGVVEHDLTFTFGQSGQACRKVRLVNGTADPVMRAIIRLGHGGGLIVIFEPRKR